MKKEYKAPELKAQEVKPAANSVCGWFTRCGEQVQQRD